MGLGEDNLLDDVSLIFSQEDSKVEVDSVTEVSSGAVEQATCKDETDGSEIVEVLLQDLPIPDYYLSTDLGWFQLEALLYRTLWRLSLWKMEAPR
jgi:hypothetical protein